MSERSLDALAGAVVRVEWAAETAWRSYAEYVLEWAGTTTVGLRPLDLGGVAHGLVVAPWSSVLTLSPVR